MRSQLRSLAVAGLAALLVPAVAVAQRPIEFGLDGGIQFKLNDPTFTSFTIPFQSFRVGFFLSDRTSFEPSMSLNWVKVESSDAATALGLGASVLHHFSPAGRESQGFVRPAVGFQYVDLGIPGASSETQFSLGGGIGIKIRSANRFAIRLEGSYAHGFESGFLGDTDIISFTVGFSFFTR